MEQEPECETFYFSDIFNKIKTQKTKELEHEAFYFSDIFNKIKTDNDFRTSNA